ncbi:hypothetical protein E1B28_002558 [Marasmius oreades]|uniref:Uncharacterized protein n=1 Tax=Marasmius oreades TaxID=181124 RepID=A0A9P7UP29_9AGAR|nr:uncharacterized protein E1B28_002558 [Marasmius oreades]KAG7086614.1 hypothetical protein E1B28_002558 [Marasmius oreades]
MRFAVPLVSVLLAVSASLAAPAVSLESRQIGNLACNVARGQIVAALNKSGKNLKNVDTSTDPAAAGAVTTAQTGLKAAGDGIKTIALSIITGQASPAGSRDQVANGIQSATDALTALQSTDPNVETTLQSLADATAAGQKVVATCK